MLRLIAHSKEDGWAFVGTPEGIRLVRPPYTQEYMPVVNGRTVEASLLQPGFAATDQEFTDWRTLINYLNQEVAKSRQGLSQLSGGELGEAILEFAPLDVLDGFLRRVGNELLPARKWDHAEAILRAVLKAPAACGNPNLIHQVVDLMDKASNLRHKTEKERCDLVSSGVDWGSMFPLTEKHYGQNRCVAYAREVSEHQPLFRIQ